MIENDPAALPDRPVIPFRVGKRFIVLAMLVSSALGGWFVRAAYEDERSFQHHAALLSHFLEYNPSYGDLDSQVVREDMRMIAFHVHDAWVDGIGLEKVLTEAIDRADMPENLKALTLRRLLENHEQALTLGLYTSRNLHALARGQAPTITIGPDEGELADIVPIVPDDQYPGAGNLFANLEWRPHSEVVSGITSSRERVEEYVARYNKAHLEDPTLSSTTSH